ncbi:MAG: phospholipase D-like domain-containing protein [Planctomycetota bacterium]
MALILLLVHLFIWLVALPHVLLQDKPPVTQVGWLLGILALPVIGVAAYVFFGTDRMRLQREQRRAALANGSLEDFAVPPSAVVDPASLEDAADTMLLRAIGWASGLPPTRGNTITELVDGPAFYRELETAIRQARHQVWIQVYVWRPDEVGAWMRDLLAEVARKGVAVYVLADELGSNAKQRFFAPLRAAGGHFSWTTTLHPRRNRWFFNLRNHRKVMLIDGTVGFVGGMNIGHEYVEGTPDGAWHDMQARIEGPAVRQVASLFVRDWFFATREHLGVPEWAAQTRRTDEGTLLQVLAGGPDEGTSAIGISLRAIIERARERLVLTTPYFVPDEQLVNDLVFAAVRGVAVTLCISSETDMGPMVLIGRTFYDRLLRAGVVIYEYGDDIHHSKCIVVDGRWAMVGSINLDSRSTSLNYEVGVLADDPALAARVEELLAQRRGDTPPVDREQFAGRSLRQRLIESSLRLLAPLL